MSGRTVGTWMLIYVTLFKSIRKASKVISRDRVGYHCSQQTKICLTISSIKRLTFFVSRAETKAVETIQTMNLASLPVRTRAHIDE